MRYIKAQEIPMPLNLSSRFSVKGFGLTIIFDLHKHFLFDRSVLCSRNLNSLKKKKSKTNEELCPHPTEAAGPQGVREKALAGPQHKHKCPNGEHLKFKKALKKKNEA